MSSYSINPLEQAFNQGHYQDVLHQIDELKDNDVPDIHSKLKLYYFESRTYERLGKWETAWNIYLEAENIVTSYSQKDKLANLILLVTKLYLLWRLGSQDEAKETINSKKDFISQLENELLVNDANNYEYWLGLYFIIQFNIYLNLGNLEKALLVNEKSLTYFRHINYEFYLSKVMINFGLIHRLKGELQTALESFTDGSVLAEKNNDPITLIEGLYETGISNYLLGEFDEAIKYLTESLTIAISINNLSSQAKIYFKLITLYYSKELKIETSKYVDLLNKISQSSIKNNYTKQLAIIGSSLSELLTGTMKGYVTAQDKLKEVLNDPVVDFDIQIFCNILLTEIYLVEYQTFYNNSTLEEIERVLGNLFTLANKNNSIIISIESRLLQARIQYIAGNFDKAENIFNQTEKIATENNLNLLKTKIVSEHKKFVDSINQMKKNLNKRSENDVTSIRNYIQELKKVALQMGDMK